MTARMRNGALLLVMSASFGEAQTAPNLAVGQWTAQFQEFLALPPLPIKVTQMGLQVTVEIDLPAGYCQQDSPAKQIVLSGTTQFSSSSLLVSLADSVGPRWTASSLSPFDQMTGLFALRGDCYQVDVADALTATRPGVPNITQVGNAASAAPVLAPGMLATILGSNLGQSNPLGAKIDQAGLLASSEGGVQVQFGGVPSPLLYVSASQINSQVPYEVSGRSTVTVSVNYNGQISANFDVRIAPTAPAVFTANGSGTGQAAALNQDGHYNSPQLPALKGEYVTIFLTGHGLVSPATQTGAFTVVASAAPITPYPVAPVQVLLNGQEIQPSFVGEVPECISGVLQINLQIPADSVSGKVPILVNVGGTPTQAGVFVSVF